MNVFNTLKDFLIGFLVGLFGKPDFEELKPERIQFWDDMLDPAWVKEESGTVLRRTFIRGESRSVIDLAESVTAELEPFGYHPNVEIEGKSVTVRLTTPSAGQITERDYAAAALIDLTL